MAMSHKTYSMSGTHLRGELYIDSIGDGFITFANPDLVPDLAGFIIEVIQVVQDQDKHSHVHSLLQFSSSPKMDDFGLNIL